MFQSSPGVSTGRNARNATNAPGQCGVSILARRFHRAQQYSVHGFARQPLPVSILARRFHRAQPHAGVNRIACWVQFQSSPGVSTGRNLARKKLRAVGVLEVSILARRFHRAQLVVSQTWLDTYFEVSILARRFHRAQRLRPKWKARNRPPVSILARRFHRAQPSAMFVHAHQSHGFQSSPGVSTGRNLGPNGVWPDLK